MVLALSTMPQLVVRVGCEQKDGRFGGWEERMTWHGGTHELGRRIGKLPEQIVFWDENIFTPLPIALYRGSNLLHLLELL
jgi:hypothetical protein